MVKSIIRKDLFKRLSKKRVPKEKKEKWLNLEKQVSGNDLGDYDLSKYEEE